MSRFRIEIKWALIFAISMIIWLVLERIFGLHSQHIQFLDWADWLFVPIGFVIYYFAINDKKKNYYNGTISWLQGLVCGTIIGVLVAFLSPIIQVLNHVVISPEYFKNVVQFAISDVNPNKITDINDAFEKYNLKSYIIQSVLTAPPKGMLTAAIVSLFVMNHKNKLSNEKLDF